MRKVSTPLLPCAQCHENNEEEEFQHNNNTGSFLLYLPQAWFLLLEQAVPAAQTPAGNTEC